MEGRDHEERVGQADDTLLPDAGGSKRGGGGGGRACVEIDISFRSLWKLYLSRFLTAWGDRFWGFGVGMFLFKIHPGNLSLMAGYGLANCLSVIVFGAAVGNWIDSTGRLSAARTFLLVQNSCLATNCAVLSCYFLFGRDLAGLLAEHGWLPTLLAALVIVLALLANLASEGSKIVVEKDWIVAIADGNDEQLARVNSVFRTVDLVCLTVSPVLAGALFTFTSYAVAALVMGAWNIVSMVAEYILLQLIYRQFPVLSRQKEGRVKSEEGKCESWLTSKVTASLQGWKSYMRHKVRYAGLGLSCLYMTVLGFDNITWGYALMQCVTESSLGLLVAMSALFGISGSLLFPKVRRSLGEEKSGLIGMTYFVASLSLCVISIWLPGSPFDPSVLLSRNVTSTSSTSNCSVVNGTTYRVRQPAEDSVELSEAASFTSVWTMMLGIVVSRFGLWMADLSITQIFQENVEEARRGVIGGVQGSLNNSMDLLKYVLVLLLPWEKTFGLLVIFSYTFICLGAASLSLYAAQQSKYWCQKPSHTPS